MVPLAKLKTIIIYLSMTKYRLNRTVFKGKTASEAADHAVFYKM